MNSGTPVVVAAVLTPHPIIIMHYNMKLWDYDPHTLLPNLPTMVTFPNLHNFYEDWRKYLESRGVDIGYRQTLQQS